MRHPRILQLLGLASLASLARAAQPSAPEPIEAPLRDLEFGTINFLHTTDTHGWHAGHLLEPSYSADWGDYIDFSTRLREKIEADGNDLLVVDTGDRVEGNGLYDASEPKGKYTFDIFKEQYMDIICVGNHELYKQNSSENDYNLLVPFYKSAYIASNLDIIDPEDGEVVPFAGRFRKFTTKNQKLRILAFGFIFDFAGNYNNTIIHPVEKTVQEQWFQRVIQDRAVDLIVVTAHAAARSDELNTIYKAIREVQPNIPIQIFAGHQHIRDYKRFDDKAYALASGRFMETIGFQSIDGLATSAEHDNSAVLPTNTTPTWFRRYIDNNLFSFYHHSKTNASTFRSSQGEAISSQITTARTALNLDEKYGCAPHDLWMSRVPFPNPTSIFTWLNETVFPEAVLDSSRSDKSRLVIANTGAVRFDIFQGAFTKDSTFIVSPFTSGMHYLRDVPLATASNVLALLNQGAPAFSQQSKERQLELWRLAPPEQWGRSSDSPSEAEQSDHHHTTNNQFPLSSPDRTPSLIPGYTTVDDLGTDGDDTIHTPIKFYWAPNAVQSYIPAPNSPSPVDEVDLIFNEFLQPYILLALQFLGGQYTAADVEAYLYGETMTDMITRWIRGNWGMDC